MFVLSPFRSDILKTVNNGANTLLWFDKWHSTQALKDLWPLLFNDCTTPWITVSHFFQHLNMPENLFHTATLTDLFSLLGAIPDCSSDQTDLINWSLEKKGIFSVKSFYKFLIDGGVHNSLYSQF